MKRLIDFIKPTIEKITLAIIYFIFLDMWYFIIEDTKIFNILTDKLFKYGLFDFLYNLIDYYVPIIGGYFLACVVVSFIKNKEKVKLFHINFSRIIVTCILFPFILAVLVIFTYLDITNYGTSIFSFVVSINILIAIILSYLVAFLVDSLYSNLKESDIDKKFYKFSYMNFILFTIFFSFLFYLIMFFSYYYGVKSLPGGTTDTLSELIFNNQQLSLPTPFFLNLIIAILLSILLSYLIKYILRKWEK